MLKEKAYRFPRYALCGADEPVIVHQASYEGDALVEALSGGKKGKLFQVSITRLMMLTYEEFVCMEEEAKNVSKVRRPD